MNIKTLALITFIIPEINLTLRILEYRKEGKGAIHRHHPDIPTVPFLSSACSCYIALIMIKCCCGNANKCLLSQFYIINWNSLTWMVPPNSCQLPLYSIKHTNISMSVFVSSASVFTFCLCYSAVHAANSERGLDAAAQF